MAHSILIPRDREGRRGKLSPATEEAVDNKWIICSVHFSGCVIKSGHHHRACGFRLTRGSLHRDRESSEHLSGSMPQLWGQYLKGESSIILISES